jgi:hypothetical protein
LDDLSPAPSRGFFYGRAYTLCGIAQKFTLPHGITTGTFVVVVGFPSSHSWSNNLQPRFLAGLFHAAQPTMRLGVEVADLPLMLGPLEPAAVPNL